MKLWSFIVTVLACLAFCYTTQDRFIIDFLIYRQVGMGNLSINILGYTWLYADFLAPCFVWLSWFSYQTALVVWYAILILSCSYVSTKLIEVHYALLLLAIPAYCFSLYSGNIYPLLIALSFSPWTLLLAVLFKPHLAGFVLVMAFSPYIRNRFFTRLHPQYRPDTHSSVPLARS